MHHRRPTTSTTMDNKRVANRTTTATILLAFVIFLTIAGLPSDIAHAQAAEVAVAVEPAQFAFYINPPGTTERLSRPTSIFFDKYFGELFVTDMGNNRISIFDGNGRYKYEFTGGSYFSSPVDIAVDAEGYIFVLGSTSEGRHLFKFDFDGKYVATYEVPSMYADTSVMISSFDLSDSGELFLFDQIRNRVLVMYPDGEIARSFEVFTGLTGEERIEQVVGKLRICGSHIVLVSGSLGSAYIYDLEGQLERRVGHKGSERGQLAFPAAATMTSNGTVIILDRMSHNYVIFDSLSRPVAEIGGRGDNPGWFYQPTLLELDNHCHVIIGQIFHDRVQSIDLPDLDLFKKSDNCHPGIRGSAGNTGAYHFAINEQHINETKRASDATKYLNAISNTRIPRRYF